ncbi:HNH endonuclease signature motif containing protein [Cryptosporangium minutisporangium]|uniref:HNH nuclease domain-containing protein n=1 Tax=Cryptosporangium minutisporangium TaxID=113569 RepID=A0ABP6T566_9ACTN
METGLGRLTAAADEVVTAADLAGCSDAALLERLRSLARIRSQVDAALVAAVGMVHQRGAVEYDGALSTKSWLQARLRLAPVESSDLVEVARHLADHPTFADDFRAGRVSLAHVRVAARLAKKIGPDHAADALEALLGPALSMDPAALKHVAKRIHVYLRPEDDDDPAPDEADRALYNAQTFDGTWDLAGTLTPEVGALAQTYLTAAAAKRGPEDDRAPCQRRHDAIAELFRAGLDAGHLPTHGGERPHLAVLVHAHDLQQQNTPHRKRRRLAPIRFDGDDALTALHAYPDDDPTPIPPDWATDPDPGLDTAAVDWDALLAIWADDADHNTAPDAGFPPDTGLPDTGLPGTGLPGTGLHGAALPESGLAPGPALPESGLAPGPALGEAIAAAVAGTGRRSHLPTPGMGGLTEYGGFLSSEAVRRLACDAGINRVVLDPHDIPINAGHRNRLPSPGLRRILAARDGGCRFHGCDRPPAWTQAHHVVHWADGGPTNLDNLILVCGYHHHLVHDHHWSLTFNGRELTIRRPDGTTLDPP